MLFRDSFMVSEGNFRIRAVAFPFSVAAHLLLGLLLVILPLIRTEGLPRVEVIHTFLAPLPPVAPPAPPGGGRGHDRPRKPIRLIQTYAGTDVKNFVVPVEIPSDIAEEPVGAGNESGFWVEGGDDSAPGEGILKGVVGPVLADIVSKIEVPVRAGIGEIRQPKRIKYIEPVYPEIARQARVQGVVIIEATTDPFGRVVNWSVLKSIPLLDGAAVEAVRQWVYEPMIINGRPRGVAFTVTVVFQLK